MKKTSLQVSKKFYLEITERINNALSGYGTDNVNAAIAAVDAYIADGKLPDSDTGEIIRLTFRHMQPEIDKARERSRKARQRHSSRSNEIANTAAVEVDSTNGTPETAKTSIPPQPQPNRRLHRLLAQEEKRQQRRRDKALLRKTGTPPAQLRA